VLALRGDPPRGQTNFAPVPDGFRYGAELAAFIKHRFRLCIAGACYPEKHPECESFDQDLLYLKEKVHAGAEFLITQLFFDNQKYFDFVAKARAIGIGVPIVPGIMPITNLAQVERITKMCGASIPETLLTEMQRVQDKPDAVLALGVAQATAQCLELLHRGAPGIHFYTLNKSAATRMILTAIRTVWPPARYPA
jgi:methylenetetrahydrofolate reductase (NADPH)